MSKPKLYGIAGSRAIRSLWAIEETGIDYEHVPVGFGEDSKTAEYLAVNPNGRVPALEDGDLILFESMAINLYLAKTYAKALYPADPAAEALAIQWSVWGISEIEDLQIRIALQKFFTPEAERDPAVIAAAEAGLARPFKVLDQHLDGRDWLVGDAFSIADLNLAGVMSLLQLVEVDLSGYPNIQRWANACLARPAYARAQRLGD